MLDYKTWQLTLNYLETDLSYIEDKRESDATQQEKCRVAKKELWNRILNNEKFKRVPLLLLVNKQDLPEMANLTEIIN